MDKYLVSCGPNPKKPKTSTDLTRIEKQRDYDQNTRKRGFQASWLTSYPWILYDSGSNSIFCTACRAVYGHLSQSKIKQSIVVPDKFSKYVGGPFVSGGCKNLKLSAIKVHNESEGHRTAQQEINKKKQAPGSSKAEQCIQMLNKSSFEKLENLFRTAHGIAKHCGPFTQFQWICELDCKKGVVIGNTYRSDKACREFIKAIAATERKKIEGFFDKAKFMTLLSDGSTDVSVKENEIVFARFAVEGIIYIFFLALVAVEKADASHIFEALQKAVSIAFPNLDLQSSLSKVVGFAADGASVNTGDKGGVIALMRQNLGPDIVMVKCLVHRLELAYKEAMKKSKLYSKLMSLMSGLYAFYHTSPLQRSNLKQAAEATKCPFAVPLRVGGTRWVSHTLLALTQLWKAYPALEMHLSQVR